MYLVIFNPLYYFICIGKSTYNGSFDFPSVIIIRQFFDTFITTEQGTAVTVKKSVQEIAREVVAGKWGNGEERKKKLIAAGYDYSAVQAAVNALMG